MSIFYIAEQYQKISTNKSLIFFNKVRVFAGVDVNGRRGPTPVAKGRLCEWKEDPEEPPNKFSSFGAYQVKK